MFRFLSFVIIVTIFNSCFSSMVLNDGLYLIEQQNDKCGLTTQMSTKDSVWRTTLIPFEYDTIYGLDELGYFVIDDDGTEYHDFVNGWCIGQKDNYLYFINLYHPFVSYNSKNQYDDVKMMNSYHKFDELRIAVKKGEKWGIIDKYERDIVPIEYDEIGYLNVKNGMVYVRQGEKWGVNSIYNEFVGTMTEYDKIEITDSKKPLFIAKREDNWGLISLCNTVLPFEYQKIQATVYPNYFIVQKGDKYGVWDTKTSSMMIEPKFTYLADTYLMNYKNKPKKALFVYATKIDELFWVDKNGEILEKIER